MSELQTAANEIEEIKLKYNLVSFERYERKLTTIASLRLQLGKTIEALEEVERLTMGYKGSETVYHLSKNTLDEIAVIQNMGKMAHRHD